MNIAARNQPSWIPRYFERLTAYSVGLWLVFAAIPHIQNPYYFLGTVYSYKILPTSITPFVAATLPWAELFLGISLILDVFKVSAYWFCAILFLVFLIAQSYLKFVLGGTHCGCFGPPNPATEILETIGYYLVILACMASFLQVVLLSRIERNSKNGESLAT